jgi:predicted PurR-regulated permease PerM
MRRTATLEDTRPAETGEARVWRPYMGPLVILGTFLAFWILFKSLPGLTHVVFFAFFSVVLAALFDIPTSFFHRFAPRPVATLLTLLLLLGILAGTLSLIVPLFLEQSRKVADHAPAALEKVRSWWDAHTRTGILGKMSEKGDQGIGDVQSKLGPMMKGAIPLAFGTVAAAAQALLAVVLGLYLTLNASAYVGGFVHFFPKRKDAAVLEVLDGMGVVLKAWTRGTLLSMAIIGTITSLGLYLLGVEGWFALGVLSFLGEFIPFAGPVLSAVPGLAVGLAESPHKAALVLLLYVATHQLESHLVQPLIMRRAIRIQPAVLILWQLAFSMSFGFMGLIVATPLLAVIQSGLAIGYEKRALGRDPLPTHVQS